jgi:hypothetical protein
MARTSFGFRNCSILNHFKFKICSVAALWVVMSALRANAQIPTNGLIGYWTGNNTAADASTIGNNGSFSGSYVPGGPGGDAAFDLSTGKVTVPNNTAYDGFQSDPGWTVGFWFNTNGTNSSSVAFLGQDNGPGFQPKWFIDYGYTVFGPNTDFVWHVNDFNTERIFLTSESVNPIPSGWNQLTVVTDNTDNLVNFYLNGQPIGADGFPSYVLETTAPLIFGDAEGLSFNGLMNNVTIYDRALSPQEVLQLQNVPEPASAFLLIGIAMLAGFKRFGRKGRA